MAAPALNPTLSRSPRGATPALTRYAAAREAACDAFRATSRIAALWRALTQATDELLQSVAAGRSVTVIAVGGYGRRELFPFSDVDVLVLLPEDAGESASESTIALLQHLWDFSVPVSHAVRTLSGAVTAARGDTTIASALMDARYVAGDRRQYIALKRALKAEVLGRDPRGFVEAKLAERDRRHAKWGDSRFLLEPNVKESKGGLRDLQTLTWLARYCYGVNSAAELVRPELLTDAERKRYRNAYLFFSVVRAHMHILRGRVDERLTFDLQAQIATLLKFRGRTAQERAERFMQRYFQFTRHVGSLTRMFCALLEEENLRRVPSAPPAETLGLPDYLKLENGRLQFSDASDFAAHPHEMIGLFAEAQRTGLDISPRAHLALTRALPSHGRKLPLDRKAGRLLLTILLSPKAPETTLRRMSEMGALSAILPEFAKISGQMQYDGYHTYTVDEHTLVAIGNLAALEAQRLVQQFPLASVVARDVGSRAPLYLGMLCHDIAKGQGGKDGGGHGELGEEITRRIAARLGMSEEEGQLAAWLVRHHLVFSEVAFKRDLDDPKTLGDFVALVQSPERLRLLLLLTVADIKAVGPAIWNGWKGTLMRELYQRSLRAMGVAATPLVSDAERNARFIAAQPQALQENAAAFLAARPPAGWWTRPEEEQQAALAVYAEWKKSGKPAVHIRRDAARDITELTGCVSHEPQLFRVLAGVMGWIGASIVTARIMLLEDGAAIASIGVQDLHGHAFAEEERLARLPALLRDGLKGKLDFARELPRRRVLPRGRAVPVRPAVFIGNEVSAESSVVEVNALDRLGLLYDMLGALAECGLTVTTAHIATYGAKAVDVFYVRDAYGHKVIHRDKLAQLQQALLAACDAEKQP
ncbi:MAG: [protein-PII] uridylyltransferase [Alphaproteobacteria bacterium]